MSKLGQIIERTRARVADAKSRTSTKELEKLASEHTPRGFRSALRQRAAVAPAIIAELKKASPSKGVIRESFAPAELAREMEKEGATCLSVLTEPEFFQGSLGNLEIASSETRLPCLRKDFMIDEFQMLEARAHGADAVLLIVAALTDSELREFHHAAKRIGLDVLCEVHDHAELERAIEAGATDMIGVNNRNLRDFSVSLDTSLALVSQMPKGSVCVAESGIASHADITRLRDAGFHAFLIGETLMRAPHPGSALRQLLAAKEEVHA